MHAGLVRGDVISIANNGARIILYKNCRLTEKTDMACVACQMYRQIYITAGGIQRGEKS